MKQTRVFAFCLSLSGWFAFSAFDAVAQEAKKLHKVRLGVGTPSLARPLYAARDQGYYQRRGLDIEIINMRPSIQTAAVINGDIYFSTTTTRDMGAAMAGLPMRIVMVLAVAPPHKFVVKGDIKSVKDLKGRTVGVSGPKQLDEVIPRKAIEKAGLKPGADVNFISLGGSSDLRLNSLLSGRIDAALLAGPHTVTAVKQGFRVLFAARDMSSIIASSFGTTLERIKTEPNVIVGVLAGTLQGNEFLKQNRPECLKYVAKDSGIKDPELANQICDDFIDDRAWTGTVADEALMETIEFTKEVQGITRKVAVSEIADWTLAKRALEELKKIR
jgi:NitT/TauT family transport system substrate-binding protein